MTLKELITWLRFRIPAGGNHVFIVSKETIYETQLIYAEFETIGACAAHIAKEIGCQQVKLENGDYKFFTT